jgi:hypothetical protein
MVNRCRTRGGGFVSGFWPQPGPGPHGSGQEPLIESRRSSMSDPKIADDEHASSA